MSSQNSFNQNQKNDYQNHQYNLNNQNNISCTELMNNSTDNNDARLPCSPNNSYGQNVYDQNCSSLNESQPQVPVIAPLPHAERPTNGLSSKKRFSTRQTQQLTNVFDCYSQLKYCPPHHFETLVAHTGLNELQVKQWFHNRRNRAVKETITQSTDKSQEKEELQTTEPVLSSLGCVCCVTGVDIEAITPVQYFPRAVLSPWQVKILEKGFTKTRYVAYQDKKNELNALVEETGLPDCRIIRWFQKRRRKAKRQEKKAMEKLMQQKLIDDRGWNAEIEKKLESIYEAKQWINERECNDLAEKMGISSERIHEWLVQFKNKQQKVNQTVKENVQQSLALNQINVDETFSTSSTISVVQQNQCREVSHRLSGGGSYQRIFDEILGRKKC